MTHYTPKTSAPKARHLPMRGHVRMAMLALLFCLSSVVTADELKVGNFWMPDVQVQSIADGQITYLDGRGQSTTKPLAEITGVRLADHPQLEEAAGLLERGDAAGAVELLEPVYEDVAADWAKAYAGWMLWRAQAATGEADDTIKIYTELAIAKVDPYFLADPPVQLVQNADESLKPRIERVLTRALRRADDSAEPLLQALIEAAKPEPAPAAPPATTEAAPATTETADAPPPVAVAETPAGVDSVNSAVTLPWKLAESQATRLLAEGKFDEALAQIDTDIKIEGGLAVDLYLRAIGTLYIAEASGDLETYKDAGLDFMRVVTYFPRSDFAGRNLIGGSLLELAYIHDKLGAPEKATELYQRAETELSEESDPNLYQRLQQLRSDRE